MNKDQMFLSIIALFAAGFAVFNGIVIVLKANRSRMITGTVISVTMPNPVSERMRNSKWALLSYVVDGKMYTSSGRIQVPMSTVVGSRIRVRYDMERPDRLYSCSWKRVIGGVGVAVGCGVLMMLFRA